MNANLQFTDEEFLLKCLFVLNMIKWVSDKSTLNVTKGRPSLPKIKTKTVPFE